MFKPSLTTLNPHIIMDQLKLPPQHKSIFNVCFEEDPPFTMLDARSGLLSLPVKFAKILTKGEDVKEVMELEFDQNVPNKGGQINIVEYEPGWTVGILPQNDPEEVQQLMEQLNMSDQSYILQVVKPAPKDMSHIPFRSTVRSVFLNVLDIRRIPSKNFLNLLSTCTANQDHASRLQQLSSHQGKSDYRQFIEKKHLSFLDLMKAFPTCKPGFADILQHLPRLQPRIYTISSSPLSYEPEHSRFTITFSVTPDHKNGRYGVCSGYLNRIGKQFIANRQSTQVSLYFRTPTSCSLPADRKLPILMIASGLGIAPFIGFMRHRHEKRFKKNEGWGQMVLILGCRYPDRDHIYKNEIEKYLAEGTVTKCYTAFSREEPFEIKYVQDQINKKHTSFAAMLQRKKFIVYYCGELRWSRKTVYKSFVKCLQEIGYSEQEAIDEIDSMTRNYKIVWTDWPQ